MRLSRWMLLIAGLVVLGCLTVAQRTALFVTAYGVGDRMQQVHTKTVEVSWRTARLAGLSSPQHLAGLAKERGLQLVAWSTFPEGPSTTSPVRLASRAPGGVE